MILRSASDSKYLPDLDTMRSYVINKTTKSRNSMQKTIKEEENQAIDSHIRKTYKRGWESNLHSHNVNMVIETGFDSLNDFILKTEHSNKYVTRVIYNYDYLDSRTKQINGFKNLVTITKDYNCCLHGLSEYLTLPYEEAVEMVEDRFENSYYSKEAVLYALMNDCVKEEYLMDYSAAKLALLRRSINHFVNNYGYDLEFITDKLNKVK